MSVVKVIAGAAVLASLCLVLAGAAQAQQKATAEPVKIIFLHHSTGHNVWNGGVAAWFDKYNKDNGKAYQITERAFPSGKPYEWKNYPFDYWNIWVKNAGPKPFMEEPTLEILAPQYKVIVFKHCFPVSGIGPDKEKADVKDEDKTLGNYKAQYAALKDKLHQFKENKFIVWTGAALVEKDTNAEEGKRAREFFDWVKKSWDEPGDNIFVWDFFELETEGGLFLKGEYAAAPDDSHPNAAFCKNAAPLFSKRIVDVIEGRGDSGSLTGK